MTKMESEGWESSLHRIKTIASEIFPSPVIFLFMKPFAGYPAACRGEESCRWGLIRGMEMVS